MGSLITNTGVYEMETRRRIALSRTAMVNLKNIWADKEGTKNTKLALVQSPVVSIFSYGSELWLFKVADR